MILTRMAFLPTLTTTALTLKLVTMITPLNRTLILMVTASYRLQIALRRSAIPTVT